jgi:hypothetical protein
MVNVNYVMARDIKQMREQGIYKTAMMKGMKKGMKKGKPIQKESTCPKCGKMECECDED